MLCTLQIWLLPFSEIHSPSGPVPHFVAPGPLLKLMKNIIVHEYGLNLILLHLDLVKFPVVSMLLSCFLPC